MEIKFEKQKEKFMVVNNNGVKPSLKPLIK